MIQRINRTKLSFFTNLFQDTSKDQIFGDTLQSIDMNQDKATNFNINVNTFNDSLGENGMNTDRFNIDYKSSDFEEQKGENTDESSLRKSTNPMSLIMSYSKTNELNFNINQVLSESKQYAEELEMKIDKIGDIIEITKEEQIKRNLDSLDKSLSMIEDFKKLNRDSDNTSDFLSK